ARGSKPAARQPARGERIEPRLGGVAADGDRARSRGKTRKTRSRRERRPWTLGGIIGRLIYWGFVLAVWGGIAVGAVVAYYAVQLPSSDTWAVPARPANIRIVAANGQLISNRGQMGGEAVALRELPHY